MNSKFEPLTETHIFGIPLIYGRVLVEEEFFEYMSRNSEEFLDFEFTLPKSLAAFEQRLLCCDVCFQAPTMIIDY
jgi:hypothetical protein